MNAVARRYTFSATHHLDGLPPPYCDPHSHLYTVEVVAEGELDDDGMVIDTAALDARWDEYRRHFEGQDLNVTLRDDGPTTVEQISDNLLHVFRRDVSEMVVEVTVWEDSDRWGRARV